MTTGANAARAATLDERWLAFVRRSAGIAERHPRFVEVRQDVFLGLIKYQPKPRRLGALKKFFRHWIPGPHSLVAEGSVDVAFWLDGRREVLVEAMVPVWLAAVARGLKIGVILSAGVADAVITPEAARTIFHVPAIRRPTADWREIFKELEALFPGEVGGREATFLEMGARADAVRDECRRVLSSLRPKMLVLSVDQVMPASVACAAAHELGIRSLVLLHGSVSPYNAPLNADAMAVWGEVSREQMAWLGVAPHRLLILGSARHDRLPHVGEPAAGERLRNRLRCNNSPCFTFFSNGNDLVRNSPEAVRGCAAWLQGAARRLGGRLNCLVRLHPNEDGSVYRGMSELKVFREECDLGTTFAGSEAIGALCSTALAEAVLYSKPVLQFWDSTWPDLADNWRRGLALRVSSECELIERLESWLTPGERQAAAEAQRANVHDVYANQGRAGDAIADYIADNIKAQ